MYEGFQISHDTSPVSEGVCSNSSCTVLNTEHKDKEENCSVVVGCVMVDVDWCCNCGTAL